MFNLNGKIARLRLSKTIFRINVILLLILCYSNLWAVTRTSTATGGNWNAGGTWVGGVAPAAGDDVVIATTGVNAVTINVASTCVGVVINSGATLTATTLTLTVNGSWTNNGTFNDGTTATVTFGGTSSINGTTNPQNFQNVTLASAAALTINSPVALAGNFTYTASTANSSVTIAGTNTLSVTGTWSMPRPSTGFTSTIAVGAGTLSVTGLFTLSGTSGRNTALTISTGTANLGAVTTGTAGCLVTFTGAGTLNMSGTVSTGPPVITESTGTINYSGAGAQTVWNETYYNLTLSGGGAKTTTTVTVNNILSMEGAATASAAPTYGASATLRYNRTANQTAGLEWPATFTGTGGVIIDNTGDITTNGNKVFNLNVPLTINSGAVLIPAAGNTFTFGGDLINSGTWTASTGDVTITNTRTSQSIGRFNTSGLVTMLKASGTATFTADINGGAFTMNGAAGILNLGNSRTHTFTGAWTNSAGSLEGNNSTLNIGGTGSVTSGTFTAGNSTVNFNGAGAQNIPGFSYYNLNTATGGTKTMLAATTVTNVLTVGLSSTFATGANTLTLSGTGTPLVDNGTFTATAGGTVIYSGTTANIAAESYANLQTSTAGVKTLAGNTTVATVLTVNSPSTLETGANTLTLSGSGTPLVDNGTFTASSGSTVIFSGTLATTIAGETYANLQVSAAGVKTLGASTIASEVVTINTGSTLALSSFTLTLSGTGTPLVNSGGTFTPSTGTVIFSGATATIAALTYNNLQTSTAGVKTLAGNTTVAAVLTVNSPSTLETGANTLTLSGSGTPLVDNGTFTASSGSTVIFSGTLATTIAGETYANLQVSAAGVKTLGASTIASEVVTINTGSTLALSNLSLTLSGTGTPLVNSGGTFTASNGTVIYSGATATVAGLTYYNLQTSTTGTKTLAGATTVSNILTINSPSTLDLSSVTLTLSGAGTPLVNNGTFTCSTSTVNFSNVASTNIPALNYYNLTLTGGPRVFAASGEIGIANTFTPGAGGFTVTGSTVNFNGLGPQTIPAFTFNDLVLSGSGDKTILTATSVTVNQIDITGGSSLDLPGTSIINITKP